MTRPTYRAADKESGRGELIIAGMALVAFWTAVFFIVREVFA